MTRAAVVAGALALFASCSQLPELGVCGNGIAELERGEDCDDGDPGCSDVCRFTCTADDTCREPDHVCGVDGICRSAGGVLVASASARMDTPLVVVSDVDADGIGDMLGGGSGDLEVVFGDLGGALDRRLAAGLPASDVQSTIVTAAQIAPGRVAVAVPIPNGIGIVVATPDGVEAPAVPLVDVGERELGGVAIIDSIAIVLSRTPADPTARIEVVDPEGLIQSDVACPGDPALAADATVRTKAVPGNPTQVVIHPGGDSFCVRRYDSGLGFGPAVPVPGPPDLEAAWPLQFDADRCVEIALDLFGFQVGIVDPTEAGGCAYTTFSNAPALGGDRIVGVGDFDGDGIDGVVMTSPDGTLAMDGVNSVIEIQLRREVDTVVAADVNRDGRIDLVAGSAAEPDLSVMLALADGSYALHRVPTSFPVARALTGDVDGDTYADVYTVSPPVGDGSSRIEVHYGSPVGLLAARRAATVGDIRGVALGRLAGDDAFDDIVVSSGGAGAALSFVAGSASRSPFAPRLIESGVGFAVVAGELVADSSTIPDLAIVAAVSLDVSYGLASWWLGDLVPAPRNDLEPTFRDAGPFIPPALGAGMDDGAPAVFVARRDQVRDMNGAPLPIELLVMRATAGAPLAVVSALEPTGIPVPDGTFHEVERIRAYQLDSDAQAELLLLVRERDDGATQDLLARRLIVVDRGPDAIAPIDVAELVGARECTDATTIALGADPGARTLVVVCAGETASGVFAIPTIDDPSSIVHAVELDVADAVALVGDFDGDRIEDLVVQDASTGFGQLHLLRQCSTSPAESCPTAE